VILARDRPEREAAIVARSSVAERGRFWRRGGGLHLALAFATLAVGLAGIADYFLKLEVVFGWQGATRVSLPVAIGIAALGLGLGLHALGHRGRRQDGGGILSTVAGSLVVLTLVAGTMGFAFMQSRIEQMMSDSLARLHGDRARLFTKIILENTLDARAIATSATTVALMSRLERAPADAAARAQLAASAQSFLTSGSGWIAFYRDGRLLAQAGAPAQRPEMEVPLQGAFRRELLWDQGFFLRMRHPVREQERVLGEVVMERPLDLLTILTADINQWGETGELQLCALNADPFRCFPGRFSQRPFGVPHRIGERSSIVSYTLKGEPGIAFAPDFRGQMVLAAYGPVGNFGLGMVVKMDGAELYAPVRRQLMVMLLSLALLAALSLWLVHGRVAPLLRQLVESRRAAQANEARFLAAAESGLDGFYILESVRDAGAIVDFRVAYLNENGARLVSQSREQLLGRRLCEALPWIRSEGFFDKFSQVTHSGASLHEEIPLSVPGVKAAWLNRQVVRLGDGVAVTVRDVSERKAAEEKFKYMAQNDMLTGLPNRALFHDRFHQAMSRTRRSGQPMALFFLDIDRFKHINDTFGHAAGDDLLRAFAKRLRNCVRESDTVARLAGDEFTVILEGLHGPQDAEAVARKILAALVPAVVLAGRDVVVSSSIGIALYGKEDGEIGADALLERADQALYKAKGGGRNRYELYAAARA
jgi:diguanylate cyclase (GGDEF)-like protein